MASSLVIVVKSARTQADLNRYIKDASSPRDAARVIHHYFQRLASGLDSASFDVASSANAPVRASGTVTLTYASIVANDTVTVAGTVLTCVTGTPTGAQFKKVTDGPTTAANLASAINVHATLSKYVKATSAASVVTLTVLAAGAIGNLVTLATSNSSGFAVSAATLTGGAGGAETTATGYSRGL